MASPAMLACTLVVEGAVPDDPDSVNHGVFGLTLAVQFTVPEPRLETFSVTGEGSGFPWNPVKVIEVGFTPRTGLLTRRVTPTGDGLLLAPGALTVMVPV